MEAGSGQAAAGSVATHQPQLSNLTAAKPKKKKTGLCRFYGTKNGCRAGAACPFIHDASTLQNNGPQPKARPQARHPAATDQEGPEASGSNPAVASSTKGRQLVPPAVDGSRAVTKPVSKVQAEDPRAFQINQLRRRFSPTETEEDGGTALAFQLIPSDPDFPFEMAGLECVLHVPSSYATEGKPRLDVKNQEMGPEWRTRVQKGFARLVAGMPSGTLLGLMKELDKRLEGLLTDREEERITIVPNFVPGTTAPQRQAVRPNQERRSERTVRNTTTKPLERYTTAQTEAARQRRETETRQLEARLGRAPLYSKSSDGIAYILPITPRKHKDLPVPLQVLKSVKLFVPLLYPLEHCRVELQGLNREAAAATEKAFESKARDSKEISLMGHVNYVAQNMHVLAIDAAEELKANEETNLLDSDPIQVGESAVEGNTEQDKGGEDDRTHVKFIPRPPEWSTGFEEDDGSESDYSDSYDSDEESTDEDANGVALPTVPEAAAPTEAPERGISLSFPSLELYGIELLELTSLCITIKCERCKDTMDISNLRDKTQKPESCKKCAMPLSVGFKRRELMHMNMARAGYLDLEGCTVVDMLPSNFVPTCSECSTTYPPPGVVSVRGESTMTMCRECHRRMTFKIPEVKFLLVSAAARTNRAPVRKRPKESLGIVAGQALPRCGRCTHYSKSYRWFRFSCCSRVFACDKCHNEVSDHPNEHANRMICGLCSREQNYRPEDCSFCHSSLIRKAGSGFWEGGKGTRDKARMSRKDPRKYKRRPGGIPRKAKTGSRGFGLGKNG